jgi:hypothetical protein
MNVAATAASILGAQMGQTQLDVGMAMLRMSAGASRSMADMLSNAAQGANSLANVAEGIGLNLNTSA